MDPHPHADLLKFDLRIRDGTVYVKWERPRALRTATIGVFAMTVRERIHAEIDATPEESLDALYQVVKGFVVSNESQPRLGIMAKLREVKIDAPVDFAEALMH